MFMFVKEDMIRFKGTFLTIFYGENHIFALIFENVMAYLFLFGCKCQNWVLYSKQFKIVLILLYYNWYYLQMNSKLLEK